MIGMWVKKERISLLFVVVMVDDDAVVSVVDAVADEDRDDEELHDDFLDIFLLLNCKIVKFC